MSNVVGNSKDLFSRIAAQMIFDCLFLGIVAISTRTGSS